MKIAVIRHPKPQIDDGICYGHLDVAADFAHLDSVALQLSKLIPPNCAIYSSRLERASALAKALSLIRTDLHPIYDDRLQELNFGVWEGVRWDDIPKDAIDNWADDFSVHRFGEKESAQELIERVNNFLVELKGKPEAILVTHAGVHRAIQFIKSNYPNLLVRTDIWPRSTIGFGEMEWIELDVF